MKKWMQKIVLNFIINKILKKLGGKKMFDSIREGLRGKKTYFVAISAIIGGVIAWISGTIGTAELVKIVIEAVIACTIRAGIKNG